MDKANTFKPSYDEWLRWAQVVADRLALCANAYSKAPHTHPERQSRNTTVGEFLRRLYNLIDESDTPTESLAEVAHHDERVVDGLVVFMQDAVKWLPDLSHDMQNLLNSHWRDNYSSPLARELFHGPLETGEEGLGSGLPEHGRLPAVLNDLLSREQSSGRRRPRSALVRTEITRPNDETLRRWADINSRFMRRAGQVE